MSYATKIVADSLSPDGGRVTTMEVTYPRFVHSEFMTHRSFCLAGDTALEFDLPSGARGGRRVHRVSIADFVDRWHHGADRIKAKGKRPLDLSAIRDADTYTTTELSVILGYSKSSLDRACRDGLLVASKEGPLRSDPWLVTGESFRCWRDSRPAHTRFDVSDRLAAMSIRQYNETSGLIQTSTVSDCCFSGEKTVYVVHGEGHTLAGSADHRVLTDSGWKTIGDLSSSDLLLISRSGRQKKLDGARLQKIDGRWRQSWQREQRLRLLAEHGGCQKCGSVDNIQVHHVIPVSVLPSRAFDETNIELVCVDCHRNEHAKQGWQLGREQYADVAAVYRVAKAGVEPTFDLTIAGEYENFVANGIVVHNSRNAASSRAIPIEKTIDRVLADPAVPVEWGVNQKGMQATMSLLGEDAAIARDSWLEARDSAVASARRLLNLGLHKQIVNRVLEPFTWITVIVTATEWDGFFHQRAGRYSPLAQPEIRKLADMMLEAYEASEPKGLEWGDWHLPYIQDDEWDRFSLATLKQVSAARCARVSYLTHDGTCDPVKDLSLYAKLTSADPMHASPLEHPCTPALHPALAAGNLKGFVQLRHLVEGHPAALLNLATA